MHIYAHIVKQLGETLLDLLSTHQVYFYSLISHTLSYWTLQAHINNGAHRREAL